ncbi:MAG: hypothetical protein GTN36_03960 [Candidatus Aenigmarchaeota archaeon]|nr:hypothetical protein [Candidatus Aenigmarchaeota archaeon]
MDEKIIFVSHCILNQSIRNEKFSKIKEVVKLLSETDVGIVQLPCPKIDCNGKFIKNTTNVKIYKKYCEKTSVIIVNTIKKYLDADFKVLGILGVEFSPICGVYRINNGRKNIPGKGALIKEIENEMQKRNFQVPIISTNLNNVFSILEKINILLKNS